LIYSYKEGHKAAQAAPQRAEKKKKKKKKNKRRLGIFFGVKQKG
jgi:hypothetical protein